MEVRPEFKHGRLAVCLRYDSLTEYPPGFAPPIRPECLLDTSCFATGQHAEGIHRDPPFHPAAARARVQEQHGARGLRHPLLRHLRRRALRHLRSRLLPRLRGAQVADGGLRRRGGSGTHHLHRAAAGGLPAPPPGPRQGGGPQAARRLHRKGRGRGQPRPSPHLRSDCLVYSHSIGHARRSTPTTTSSSPTVCARRPSLPRRSTTPSPI
jgi:hypothetical protein